MTVEQAKSLITQHIPDVKGCDMHSPEGAAYVEANLYSEDPDLLVLLPFILACREAGARHVTMGTWDCGTSDDFVSGFVITVWI